MYSYLCILYDGEEKERNKGGLFGPSVFADARNNQKSLGWHSTDLNQKKLFLN